MNETLLSIIECGVVAIMRAESSSQLIPAAESILKGGITAMEISMTTPGALAVISAARSEFGEQLVFGAGTVLDSETARSAILAGAQFIVAPTFDLETLQLCRRYAAPLIPGAFTPNEVLRAWESGADVVKFFPASLGGPYYLRSISGPLPQVRLMPVGGVDESTTAEYIRAGAAAVGVGSALVNRKLLEAGDFEAITERAARLRQSVKDARS